MKHETGNEQQEEVQIALVHDWILRLGGAERVLKTFHELFPHAPIYTLFYDKKFTDAFLPNARIIPSFLQKFPWILKIYKFYLPLMPVAIEQFDFSRYAMVISSSIAFSKGIILKPHTIHICYCHSPTRFLWDFSHQRQTSAGRFLQWPLEVTKQLLRIWDHHAAQRVDRFIANSENTKRRIKKYYQRKAMVIYPPLSQLSKRSRPPKLEKKITSDYYLIVSQLYPHKNVDVAIGAFQKSKYPLIIAGDGPLLKNIRKKVSKIKNIKAVGFVSDEKLASYYKNCRALIVPHQNEDFGLTPIEAMRYGKPILALRSGGFVESIIEGVTGEFFDHAHPAVLANSIRIMDKKIKQDFYNPDVIRAHTNKFLEEKFKKQVFELIRG